jgi:HAMP domain
MTIKLRHARKNCQPRSLMPRFFEWRRTRGTAKPVKGLSRRFRWAVPGRSVAARAIYLTSIIAIGLTLVATVALYAAVRGAEEREALATLSAYSVERAARESERFAHIEAVGRAATQAYGFALAGAQRSTPEQIDARFDTLFPLAEDGTRRSSDALFNGIMFSPGDDVRGIGAFMANGGGITLVEKQQLLAAFEIVRRFGPGSAADADNFYFFTPASRLIMYAPNREDRLDFYRRRAPASFSFGFEEIVQITLPANNREGEMRCTSLQRVMYDRGGQTWTTGCMSPVYVRGNFIGAWGTSLPLDRVVEDSLASGIPGIEHIIISGEGRLIAHRALTEQGSDLTQRYLEIARTGDARMKRISAVATAVQRGGAVRYLADQDLYIAVATLRGPDWRFISVYPATEVRRKAMAASLITLAIGLLFSAALVLLLRMIVRREVVKPLRLLIRTLRRALDGREGHPDLARLKALPTGRNDEIGLLARGFRQIVEANVAKSDSGTHPTK